jgi:hypothetical protein
MAVPVGLSIALAVTSLAVAAYATFRLAAAWPWGRSLRDGTSLSHMLMGTAMAGMVVPALNVLPAPAWEGVFGAEAVWFASGTARYVRGHVLSGKDRDKLHRCSHCAAHTVMAFSMLYMYLGRGLPMGHSSMAMLGGLGSAAARGAGETTWLSLLFVGALLVSATFEVDSVHNLARRPQARLALANYPATVTTYGRWLAPRLDAVSHVAMCVVMAYMLVITW